MNKIAKRIMTMAAALALVVVLGVCMTACGNKPAETTPATELTWQDYATRLVNAGYGIDMVGNKDIVVLYANQYAQMFGLIGDNAVEIKADDVDWALMASKQVIKEGEEGESYPSVDTAENTGINMLKLKNEELAKKFEDAYKKMQEQQAEAQPDDETASEDEAEEQMVFVRDGGLVMMGYQASINIALGK